MTRPESLSIHRMTEEQANALREIKVALETARITRQTERIHGSHAEHENQLELLVEQVLAANEHNEDYRHVRELFEKAVQNAHTLAQITRIKRNSVPFWLAIEILQSSHFKNRFTKEAKEQILKDLDRYLSV